MKDLLIAADISINKKLVLEALPGPWMGRVSLRDRTRTGEEGRTAVTKANALASEDNQAVSLLSVRFCYLIYR